MSNITDKINNLPPDLQKEVENFVECLVHQSMITPRQKPSFSWAGSLKDLKQKYTSVDLQHKISDWMIAEE